MMIMDFHVFDTYVKAKDGHTMHFDVVTDKSDPEKAVTFARVVKINWRRICHSHYKRM